MKPIRDIEKKNRENLFRLMKENPNLPVIPFVDGEVVDEDESGYWMGSWGTARVDEFLFPQANYEPVIFKSDDDVFDTLERCLSVEEFDSLPEEEAECKEIYDELPWEKAIIVSINTPEP